MKLKYDVIYESVDEALTRLNSLTGAGWIMSAPPTFIVREGHLLMFVLMHTTEDQPCGDDFTTWKTASIVPPDNIYVETFVVPAPNLRYRAILRFVNGEWLMSHDDSCVRGVTHWRPLPPPPIQE